MNTIKNCILGLLAAFSIFGYIVAPLNRCSPAVPTPNAKIDTVLQVRHDTLIKLDTILKDKIKIIKAAPDTVIIKQFDTTFLADDSDTTKTVTTVGAERKALIVKDSLIWCLASRDVDSATIDSLTKLAKTPYTIKACSFSEQAKSFGLGTLFGATLRSFF